MKIVFLLILIFHGLIHLMGFAKSFELAKLNQLKEYIPKSVGVLWLVTSIFFTVAFILLLFSPIYWWIPGGVGVIFSQVLIIKSWKEAKWGTLGNIIVLAPVVVSFFGFLPNSLNNVYKREVHNIFKIEDENEILRDDDLTELPPIVKKYLIYVGALGKPKIHNFKMRFEGEMKTKKDGNWLKINSEQYSFYNNPSRLFLIRSALFGIPFEGLHLYRENTATMQIRLASLIDVANAMGKEMNQGETVTFFNDMCFFTPSGLIDPKIKWRTIDSLSVEATYPYFEGSVKAKLFFNERGELVNFVSNDRFLSQNGKKYENYPWSTPIKNYQDFEGRKIPTYGEGIWHTGEGEYRYAKFNLISARSEKTFFFRISFK